MFSRFTISEVPASRVARIAVSVLKPDAWALEQAESWVSVAPVGRRDAGFALLMPSRDTGEAERLLGGPDGLARYLKRVFPGVRELDWADGEDEMCPYELRFFHGRVPGVSGRVALVGTSVAVEDINFALLGFARDEVFHRLRPVFRTMIASFQPIVTGDR